MMGRRSVGKYHCLELNDIQRGSHGKLDKRMKGRDWNIKMANGPGTERMGQKLKNGIGT